MMKQAPVGNSRQELVFGIQTQMIDIAINIFRKVYFYENIILRCYTYVNSTFFQ